MEERALKERYTYGDYKTWDDGLRWELMDGEPFCMSPGPGEMHQSLSFALALEIGTYFKNRECRVYTAPFDVLLPYGNESEDEIDTVVQPDIMIVCDRSKIWRDGIKGAPDVVFEILSPSTAQRDMDDKFRLYERAGVKEYFIVDPYNRVITAYRKSNIGLFSWRKIYGVDAILEFELFPDLKIPLADLWEDIQDLPPMRRNTK